MRAETKTKKINQLLEFNPQATISDYNRFEKDWRMPKKYKELKYTLRQKSITLVLKKSQQGFILQHPQILDIIEKCFKVQKSGDQKHKFYDKEEFIKGVWSPRRFKQLVFCRSLIVYALKEKYNYNLKQIAKMMEYKDHTTVIHGLKIVSNEKRFLPFRTYWDSVNPIIEGIDT